MRSDAVLAAPVLVIGAGRLGRAVLAALVSAGARVVTVVDPAPAALASAADTVTAVSPDLAVTRVELRFIDRTSFDLLLEVDLVIDASGDLATRLVANDAAGIRGIPLVWGWATRERGRLGVAWDERDIDYRDLPRELSADPDGDPGAPDSLVDALGSRMAAEAVALLRGSNDVLLGRVETLDATGATHTTAFARDPDAARPGSVEERTAVVEPDPDRSVTPTTLQRLLAGPTTAGIHETPPLLLDVREAPEASFASLPDSLLIPLGQLPDRLDELERAAGGRTAPIVVYCHHGVRSARALDLLEKAGFTRARHLTGGIDAWRVQVDPEMPAY